VFTACLTTPIKVALRWFCSRSLLRHDGITKDLIDQIPGRQVGAPHNSIHSWATARVGT